MSQVSKLLDPNWSPTEYERILVLFRGGRVKRLHCIPTVNQHTVAQHVYGVIVLAVHFCESAKLTMDRQAYVMRAALYHDTPELVTGDVPAPIKRRSAAVREALALMEDEFDAKFKLFTSLTVQEQKILKAADALDLAFNALHEREMGNRTEHIKSVFLNACEYAKETGVVGVYYFTEALRKEFYNV